MIEPRSTADFSASFGIGPRWYVVYCSPLAEKAVGALIEGLGYPVCLPMAKRLLRPPGRPPRAVERPLFPRYIFARFSIVSDDWSTILNQNDVLDVLRTTGIPRAVPDGAISSLQLAVKIGIFDSTKPPAIGTEIELLTGPFAGAVGTVARARAKDRVEIMLRLLGGDRLVSAALNSMRVAPAVGATRAT